jgi:hypothetical protein
LPATTTKPVPKARTVKQLQIQKAKLARKLLSRTTSNAQVRSCTSRLLALNYLICCKAANGKAP